MLVLFLLFSPLRGSAKQGSECMRVKAARLSTVVEGRVHSR